MRYLLLTLILVLRLSAFATNYYVSPTGSNANNGLSPATPYQTIQWAADAVLPGDVVYIMNDTYYPQCNQCAIFGSGRSGTPNAYITYRNYPGYTPHLQMYNGSANSWQAIYLPGNKGSYIEIDGLTIKGSSTQVTNNPAIGFFYSDPSVTKDYTYPVRALGAGPKFGAYDYIVNIDIYQNISSIIPDSTCANDYIIAGRNVGLVGVSPGNVTIASGRTVYFNAINYVALEDGFEIADGAKFYASTGSCDYPPLRTANLSGTEDATDEWA
jgi:hypothetical protein